MSPLQSKYPRFDIDDRPFSQQFVEKIWANGYADHDRVALVGRCLMLMCQKWKLSSLQINAHKPSDRVTYRQLYLRINSLARFLRRVGFGRRSVACIVSTNCWYDYVITIRNSYIHDHSISGNTSSLSAASHSPAARCRACRRRLSSMRSCDKSKIVALRSSLLASRCCRSSNEPSENAAQSRHDHDQHFFVLLRKC